LRNCLSLAGTPLRQKLSLTLASEDALLCKSLVKRPFRQLSTVTTDTHCRADNAKILCGATRCSTLKTTTRCEAHHHGDLEEIRIKLYPLSQAANPLPTVFVDAIDTVYDSTIPYDLRFFWSLDRVVQTEPWLPRDQPHGLRRRRGQGLPTEGQGPRLQG
jgi:hypothetical protein